jgi:hypothetical protein
LVQSLDCTFDFWTLPEADIYNDQIFLPFSPIFCEKKLVLFSKTDVMIKFWKVAVAVVLAKNAFFRQNNRRKYFLKIPDP